MSHKQHYTIGQIAKETNLSIHTLRYYEKEGIVPFVKRNDSGLRVYEDEHIEWFKFICCLRQTGMSIAQLKEFAALSLEGDGTIDERIHLLGQQRSAIESQVDTLMSYIEMINFKINMYADQKAEQAD